jgi:hypothetical protein
MKYLIIALSFVATFTLVSGIDLIVPAYFYPDPDEVNWAALYATTRMF